MVELSIEQFVFDAPTSRHVLSSPGALKTVAKRYRSTDARSAKDGTGITLLLVHGTGFHKEQWEPTIQAIFNHYASPGSSQRTKVTEVWSFDWHDHGAAAVINREALKARGDRGGSLRELGDAMAAFVKSEHVKGHTLVSVSHSLGSAATLFSTKLFPVHELPYQTLFFVDPTMCREEFWHQNLHIRKGLFDYGALATGSARRRDRWSSKEEAFSWFSTRFPWKTWDTRAVRSFVDHALERRDEEVRLKCNKLHESEYYSPSENIFDPPHIISKLCHAVPIHIIWGEIPDIMCVDPSFTFTSIRYSHPVTLLQAHDCS
ncbi:hypothetical protein PC9H_003086 [Pleurotus ostreatus]|uniref:AB hydrolase-1 domain-containing protein n=1 Tax=Pleurotus ostreatus TaxID=5322 RepID=A0A8H7A097_PLEOS|nr:uncharacterized protein PC9H_003086 [Pleurotus ostreatus]KAF7436257.1 hypothetical protein PC9H_003086 [Pleurotus ostreatus]